MLSVKVPAFEDELPAGNIPSAVELRCTREVVSCDVEAEAMDIVDDEVCVAGDQDVESTRLDALARMLDVACDDTVEEPLIEDILAIVMAMSWIDEDGAGGVSLFESIVEAGV